jgi:hypothetical protein
MYRYFIFFLAVLSTFSSFRLTDQSCNLKQIANFFPLLRSLLYLFQRVTMKDSLKVTFHTKQITTNILIGEYIEPIVLVYQGLLYTLYVEMYTSIYSMCVCRNCSDLIICYVCIYILMNK